MNPEESINIDDELSVLWKRVYNGIVSRIVSLELVDKRIILSSKYIYSVLVDKDGILVLTDYNGHNDFAEDFKDCVLYEVYERIMNVGLQI